MEIVNAQKTEFSVAGPDVASADRQLLFEQYRLFVEMMDQNANRRQQANSFFFSLSAGLFAAMAFLHSKDTDTSLRSLTWIIALAGVPISIFWQWLIQSYRNLGTAKFEIIHQMEKHLPFTPYTTEWKVLEEGKNSAIYLPLTHLEVWVPRFFLFAFVGLAVWSFPWSSFQKSEQPKPPRIQTPGIVLEMSNEQRNRLYYA